MTDPQVVRRLTAFGAGIGGLLFQLLAGTIAASFFGLSHRAALIGLAAFPLGALWGATMVRLLSK